MKPSSLLLAGTVAGTLCFCLAPAGLPSLRAWPPNNKKWEQPTWKVPQAQYNEIKTVDAGAGTLSIEHVGGTIKIQRDLKVTAFTTIIIQDKKVTLAALRPGMRVDYTLSGSGDTVSRLEIVDPPPPPPTPVPTVPPSFPKGNKPN